MKYNRVLPRDAFNESKLLKCIGQLTLLIEDRIAPESISYILVNDQSFQIEQDNSSGDIYVKNIVFITKGIAFQMYCPLNSRENYPAFFIMDEEETPIFDDKGELHLDFLTQIS